MKQSITNITSGLGSFAVAAAIWMWGYSTGEGKSDAVVSLIKEDRDMLREKNKEYLENSESLRTQLLQASNRPSINTGSIDINIEKNNVNSEDHSNKSQQLTIDTQSTGVFFNGEIEITLIATNFTGTPLRHQVLANVLIPGAKPLEIRNADPGSAFIFKDYQIVITAAGTYTATFKIFKK
ncbi:hypothetical protein [Serratia nevei]|uniref:hypothetical protein n=1 Tax=Serratia nevei TaxID=2703794 RepID=UPI003F812CD4